MNLSSQDPLARRIAWRLTLSFVLLGYALFAHPRSGVRLYAKDPDGQGREAYLAGRLALLELSMRALYFGIQSLGVADPRSAYGVRYPGIAALGVSALCAAAVFVIV